MPAVLPALVEICKTDVPEVRTEEGVKLAVAPAGRPLTLNLTIPRKPNGSIERAYPVLNPLRTVAEIGLTESAKLDTSPNRAVITALS